MAVTMHPLLGTQAAPPLVGRTDELRRLDDALARVALGQGCARFLVGEAGIGKTRLARELLARARARGFRVLEARAYPLDGGLAYALFVDAFGPYLRGLDPVRQSALVSGLNYLGRLFGHLRLPPPEPLGDAALEKMRLFEAVARLVERMAIEESLALFFDDLNWADPASLELLHYLARGLAGQPILLLGAYRAEEAEAARGLRLLQLSLSRVGLTEEVQLSRLGERSVVQLAGTILGGEPPPELLELLAARSAGTPLFVGELIQALLDGGQLVRAGEGWALGPDAGAVLPASVRDLILERLERLDPGDRRVLDLIAVYGDGVPHSLLRAAGGLDDEALLVSLHRMRALGLLREELVGDGVAYGLTHPIIREVAYAELPAMARRRAHASLAAALDGDLPIPALLPNERTDRLARHYRGAGAEVDAERALDVLVSAGDRARALHANDQAAGHYEAALALVRGGRRTELLPILLERLGEVREQIGQGARAIELWSEALAAHEARGDAEAVARLHRLLASAIWDRGRFDLAQHHLDAALAALAGLPPSGELADLLYLRLTILVRLGDLSGAAEAAARLAELAERLGSARARVEAYLAATGVHLVQGDYARAGQMASRALETAEAADELVLAKRANDQLARLSLCLGDLPLARRHAERSLAQARQAGAPTLELYPRYYLVQIDLAAGRWSDALQASADALAVARRVARPRSLAGTLAVRVMVLARRGAFEEAEACLAEARAAYADESGSDRNVSGALEQAEAMLALERGEVARARAVAADFARPGAVGFDAPLGMALLGEAQVAAGECESALATADAVARLGPPADSYPAALAAWLEGIARARGESPDRGCALARAALARAADCFAKLRMPFEAARARLELATLDADGSGAQASLRTFDELGAQRYAARARRLLGQLGVRAPAARRTTRGGGALSARELEVARLVAEGLTNVEIAERLVVSPRTVTTHLDNIYTRLHLSGRAALARYVVETGLMTSPG